MKTRNVSSGRAGAARAPRRCRYCGEAFPGRAPVCPSCGASRIRPIKRASFAAAAFVMAVAAIELALRAYFAILLGPSLFWYGTSFHRMNVREPAEHSPLVRSLYQRRLRGIDDEHHNVRQHEFVAGSYTKYFPNEKRFTYDADTGEVYPVTINSRGLRGAEPAVPKAPGTLRVVTLGASSTFGYHDPDDGTYPAILERILNERCTHGQRFEVINLGIPHLTSDQIVSLFTAEGLPLRPDVVTFYEGINDSSETGQAASPVGDKPKKPLKALEHWARDRLVLVFLVDELLSLRKQRFDAAQVEAAAQGTPERFVANLARLHEECARRGILFVYAKQQARSLLIPREQIRGVTYAAELERVREKLAREGRVSRTEMNFLVHERVVSAGERWAREAGVPIVDVIAALDQDRDVLVSWVHLNPRGNSMVADAYSRVILEHTCPSGTEASLGSRTTHGG
ncbi:MAG TPA: SGNH/GDSL hydrolase family protein [Candidatus Limnocylindrales bacterium]|nr:SGNH/GDSL hydrolase family protein [Candidatus Limnocylindrales bacterium]